MNIVSYAFFRHENSGYETEAAGVARGKFFLTYMPCLLRAHHLAWPGWEMRIHHDRRVTDFPYWTAIERMANSRLVNLVDCGEAKTLTGSMLWRMKPLWEPGVGYVVCRDVDSLPMARDRMMVYEFMESGGAAHAIHDSESHTGPLMGGMVAFHAQRFLEATFFKSWDDMMSRAPCSMNVHGDDQKLLNLVVYPRVKDSLLIHTRRNHIESEAWRVYRARLQADYHDRLANHIGGCFDVERAMRYFESIDHPALNEIRRCET